MNPLRSQFAWRPRDGAVWVALSLVLGGGIATAWWRAAGKGDPDDQLAFVAVAACALVAALVANATVLLRARRSIHLARTRLLAIPPGYAAPGSDVPAGEGPVGVAGLRFHHRVGCQLVAGRQVRVLDEQERADRDPCPVCSQGSEATPRPRHG